VASLFAVVLWLLSLCAAQAHDPGLSTATLLLDGDRVEATLAFSVTDLGQIVNRGASVLNRASGPETADLKKLAAQALEIRFDERAAPPPEIQCRFDERGNATIGLSFARLAGAKLFVRSKWLASLPPGHRQFLSIRTSHEKVLSEQLLSANADSIAVEIGEAGPRSEARADSFADFVVMGMKHIWTGYDHLLFLFGLLLVTRSFGPSFRIITCFTIAHSITLAVATLSRVEFSSRIIEPLIAVSIVYVGVENLWRGSEPKGRGWLAFGFGLIHGFGFASVLRELGVGTRPGGIAVPLFSFNLGVELGQILIAAVVLPILWKLRTKPQFVSRWVPAGSVAVLLLGAYWFVERVWSN
jgi:hydrogenase/urease accessory protein HupE